MPSEQPFIPAFSVPITVGTNVWQMQVRSAVCRDDKWVVDLVLIGPRTYSLSISTETPQKPENAAQTVIGVVREWLLKEAAREQ